MEGLPSGLFLRLGRSGRPASYQVLITFNGEGTWIWVDLCTSLLSMTQMATEFEQRAHPREEASANEPWCTHPFNVR